jgi:hypothetical protein
MFASAISVGNMWNWKGEGERVRGAVLSTKAYATNSQPVFNC